jgi:hypothetical protein
MTTTTDVTNLTSMCQPSTDFTTAGLLAVLERAWAAIRVRHPDVPAAVLVVGSGSSTKANQSLKYGHFASLRWQAGETRLPEVFISGEGLSRPADKVFTTLLHEATHGLAEARNIQDTSRQGRWHNKHFATLAAELGMSTVKDDKLGYSPCTLTEVTTVHYADTITDLASALRAYRHREPTGQANGRTGNNNGVVCQCECPRKIRLSIPVYDTAPIWCPACGEYFIRDDDVRDEYNRNNPLPTTTSGRDDQVHADPDREGDDSMVFYDPTGARYGIPTYPYKFAPDGLATARQLRNRGLRPGGQDIAAQILWRKGKRVAYLYRIDMALPKRAATPAQRAAVHKALTARRTCPTCHDVKPYYIPRRYGECLDCQKGAA